MENVNLIAKEVQYHHSCRKSYCNRAGEKDCSGQDQSEVTKVRQAHAHAFKQVSIYVKETVLKNKLCPSLKSVHELYIKYLGSKDVSTDYKSSHLADKVLSYFKGELVMSKMSNKQGNVLHSKHLSEEDVFKGSIFEAKLKDAALQL